MDWSWSGPPKRGRAFYVDTANGNDNNPGRASALPWLSMAKVNMAALRAGDRVLFRSGQTWAGTKLTCKSGVTYGAWGAGSKPIVDGQNTVDCVQVGGVSGIRLIGLDIRNGYDFGVLVNGASSGIHLLNLDVTHCGNDNINLMNGAHHCTVVGCTSTNAYARTAGPVVTCLEIADGAHDITVDSLTATGSADVGLSVHAHPGEIHPYNVVVKNSSIGTASHHGIQLAMDNGALLAASPSILLSNVQVTGCVQKGLNLTTVNGGTLYPAGLMVDHCTFKGNVTGAGAYYEAEIRGANHRVTRSLFAALAERGVMLEHCTGLVFLNNTVDVRAGTGFLACIAVNGSDTNGVDLRNNVLSVGSTGVLVAYVYASSGTGVVFDYNLFYTPSGQAANRWNWAGQGNSTWANWKSRSSGDAHSPTPADPIYGNAAGGDFTLQAGSPAINAGVAIAGVTDGYLGAAPDCGYAEKA